MARTLVKTGSDLSIVMRSERYGLVAKSWRLCTCQERKRKRHHWLTSHYASTFFYLFFHYILSRPLLRVWIPSLWILFFFLKKWSHSGITKKKLGRVWVDLLEFRWFQVLTGITKLLDSDILYLNYLNLSKNNSKQENIQYIVQIGCFFCLKVFYFIYFLIKFVTNIIIYNFNTIHIKIYAFKSYQSIIYKTEKEKKL